MTSKIFISYSRKDYDVVIKLRDEIYRRTGVLPWMDVSGIETGAQFADVIATAIDECQLLVFAISQNSVVSQWTSKEVLYAQEQRKKIYPVVIEDVELPRKLAFLFADVDRVSIHDPVQCEKFFSDLISFCSLRALDPNVSRAVSAKSVVSPQSASRNNYTRPTLRYVLREAEELYSARKYQQASRLYQQCAEAGEVKAQCRLAEMYFNGRGVEKSRLDALRWVRMAAKQGDRWANAVLRSNSFRHKLREFLESDVIAYIFVGLFFGLILLIVGFFIWSRLP